MLNSQLFGDKLKQLGYNFYSGVPCSFLQDLINYAINECEYVMAANEGDAIAICCGAYLGGKKSVALMQNSGLTNATSPITSLNFCFKIPTLGFVSLRGEPGIKDEPQHELMGVITTQMLDIMQVKWAFLSPDINEAVKQLEEADKIISNRETFFFVVKKDTFEPVKLKEQKLLNSQNIVRKINNSEDTMPTRLHALESISKLKDGYTAVLATTGKTGRELYEIEDTPHNLYMVGSMGCISSLGLGLALARSDKKVIVIDGDGSLLMRMGAMATNGYYSPKNMIHILLDNNTHDSTGGQATISQNVDFVEVAASVGYTQVFYAHSVSELEQYIQEWKKKPMLTFLYLRIEKGSKKELGRPKTKPYEITDRLMKFLR